MTGASDKPSHIQMLIFFSLFLTASCTTFEDAILDDMLGSSSPLCTGSGLGSTSFNYKFTSSENTSRWASMNSKYEKDVFLAEMSHDDENPNRSWRLRFGKGGNIYSFVGAYGESVPPQYHNLAPWNDEVWQAVAVSLNYNQPQTPYYIHQAGDYLKDNLETPFTSPTLAKSCKDNQCSFLSWGQQAHIPTSWRSSAFYYTRYKDCGEGVLEVEWSIHNVASLPEGHNFQYYNVPWGGVRTSALTKMLISSKDAGGYTGFQTTPPYSDTTQTIRNLDVTLGYTTFTQKQVKELESNFTMPCGNAAGSEVPCPQTGAEDQTLRLVKSASCTLMEAEAQRQLGLPLTSCPIESTVTISTGCEYHKGCSLVFTNPSNGFSMPVQGVSSWAWKGTKILFWTQVPLDEVNANWATGESLVVSYSPAEDPKKNLALTLVHGVGSEHGQSWTLNRPKARLRYGATNVARDYTVFTVEAFSVIRPGQTYAFRQYFISDAFEGMQGKASRWVNQTSQRFYSAGTRAGRDIFLCSCDNRTFGATLQECDNEKSVKVCAGSSTPGTGRKPLFAIQCGDISYVGSDPYSLAPWAENSSGYWKPYICASRPGLRPTWRLLGYFAEGACAVLSSARFGSEKCPSELPWAQSGPYDISVCYETWSWASLVPAVKDGQATTGGLGELMVPGWYEVWLCMRDHVCPMAAGRTAGPATMCFVFDEREKLFVPWDLAETLMIKGTRLRNFGSCSFRRFNVRSDHPQ
ncbi:hypothetical protein GUITHDRAFT_138972 [Guillardia theta CCMP2712]|uniref:Uncharacterized protein n=1 Tax=Guillardia theta (strain CCMP2712) TaxID=905079 RepID=L1JAR7_GUITC|nr:hypothetical protein GUITHDRAFT_138972 [Guillardia theta CCMP2712]EKX45397.1 hypothetical protein GUITHDRAFT_138972 [Guillardia theta CCMP2712]|eukprot:XP_005832377.1 hypothetical protein GUITHDRAFT_138972 [Guillardia theta CCMP2712]